MLLVLALLFHLALLLKFSIKPLVDANAHQFNNAVVDLYSTTCHAHVCQTPMPDVYLISIDLIPQDVTVFVLTNNRAFAQLNL